MSSRFARRLALPTVALMGLAISASLALGTPSREPCGPPEVKMTHIAGSDALGHTGYRLTVSNTYGPCSLKLNSNHPALTLYKGATKSSKRLPTHVVRQGKNRSVTIAPGQSAHARLFLSPDVPGKGEPQKGPCEPVAHSVSVVLTFSSSAGPPVSAHGPIVPPTSVCEHGTIVESPLH